MSQIWLSMGSKPSTIAIYSHSASFCVPYAPSPVAVSVFASIFRRCLCLFVYPCLCVSLSICPLALLHPSSLSYLSLSFSQSLRLNKISSKLAFLMESDEEQKIDDLGGIFSFFRLLGLKAFCREERLAEEAEIQRKDVYRGDVHWVENIANRRVKYKTFQSSACSFALPPFHLLASDC